MTKLTRDDGTKLYVEAGAVECVVDGPAGGARVQTRGWRYDVRESPEDVVRLLAAAPQAEAYVRLAGARAGVEALSNVVRRLVAWDEPESREYLGEILACARAALRVLDAPEVRHD